MQSSNRPPWQLKYFDPDYYESAVISELGTHCNIQANYRVQNNSKDSYNYPEIDGLIEKNLPIEIKSYPLLDITEVKTIEKKYQKFEFDRLLIIAPFIHKKLNLKFNRVNFLMFIPNSEAIINYYQKEEYSSYWNDLSSEIRNEFATGRHNFRYRLLRRSKNKYTRILNQVDKRISKLCELQKEILVRLPKNNPPFKIYWSLGQWLDPKALYFKNSSNFLLKLPLGFDIDGKDLHHPIPCTISRNGICKLCFLKSYNLVEKLVKILNEIFINEDIKIEMLFSGKQGIHIYIYNWYKGNPASIIKKIKKLILFMKSKDIDVDYKVTENLKTVFTFPSSLNASTFYPIQKIGKINDENQFENLKKWDYDIGFFKPDLIDLLEKYGVK